MLWLAGSSGVHLPTATVSAPAVSVSASCPASSSAPYGWAFPVQGPGESTKKYKGVGSWPGWIGGHPDKGTGLGVAGLHKVVDLAGEDSNAGAGTTVHGVLAPAAAAAFHLLDPEP